MDEDTLKKLAELKAQQQVGQEEQPYDPKIETMKALDPNMGKNAIEGLGSFIFGSQPPTPKPVQKFDPSQQESGLSDAGLLDPTNLVPLLLTGGASLAKKALPKISSVLGRQALSKTAAPVEAALTKTAAPVEAALTKTAAPEESALSKALSSAENKPIQSAEEQGTQKLTSGTQILSLSPKAGEIEEARAIDKAMRKASLERDLEHYSNPDNWKTTDDVLHHQVLKEAYYNEFPEEAAKREAAIRAKEPVSDLPDYKPMEPPKSPIKLPERNPKIPPRFYPSKWIDEDGVRDIDLNKYKAYKETLEQDPFSKLKRLLKGK